MKMLVPFLLPLITSLILCCSTDKVTADLNAAAETSEIASKEGLAQVVDVVISGNENDYTFNVTVVSPDTGCEQYADWWEVIDLDGNLIYRRILTHSHVEEQPFSRPGGPIAISESTEVYVRAHMNNKGYGSAVLQGSVEKGFDATQLNTEFAEDLASADPLPEACAF